MASSVQSNPITCRSIQQSFYENLGDREYDCFQSSEEKYLKLKIGYNLFGPPKNEISGSNLNDDYTAAQCYGKNENISINQILKLVKFCGNFNEDPNQIFVSFMFNCCEFKKKVSKKNNTKPENNIGCYPIFRVRKCSGSPSGNNCCQYIDENLRVYKNWNDYLENNKIPKAVMYVPKDGKYKGDSDNNVLLQVIDSPACSLEENIKLVTDVTSTSVSVISGGIAIGSMIPAVTIAPIVLTGALLTGAGVGIYSIIRSSMILHDRNTHKQSISLSNDQARNCYLNIAAGAAGVITTGATKIATVAMNRGVVIGETYATVLMSVNGVNLAVNGCNVVNSLYSVVNDISNKRNPSALDIMHLTTSFLFFGNAVVNFRSAQIIYEESQVKSFSELIRSRSQSLWTKAKETFFNADVTSSENNSQIKIISDSDDYCQTMITAPLREQEIQSNSTLLQNILSEFITYIDLNEALEFGKNIINNKDNVHTICKLILSRFECSIQTVLLKLVNFLLKDVIIAAFEPLKELFPETEIIVVLMNFIVNFLKFKVSELEIEYQTKKSENLRELNMTEDEYDKKCEVFKNNGERMIYFLKITALRMVCDDGAVEETLFKEMIRFFWDWLSIKMLQQRTAESSRRNTIHRRRKVNCEICCGYYYID